MTSLAIMYALGIASSLSVLVFFVLDVPLAPRPINGVRGQSRNLAVKTKAFGPFESVLRLLATHVSKVPFTDLRRQFDRQLISAGEMRGMTPNEVIALSMISAVGGVAAGVYFWVEAGNATIALLCGAIGPFLPYLQLQSKAKERVKLIERGLPGAIDLAALCMGAGLDFPGAISHVVENMSDSSSPIRQELQRILHELSLGHTRKQALQGFAKRVESDAVVEFVASIIQAEEKGTPLAEVLSIQAGALRDRRSVLAEEAAARAGVLLMLPMLLMMVSIILLLMGPLIIEMSQGGMM